MKRKLIVFVLALLAVSSAALADPAVASAQQKLKDQGFYYGEINGEKDADTSAAIRRYQIRHGLQITGELNGETQHSLGLASKPATPPAPHPAQTPGPTPPGYQEQTPAPLTTPVPRQPNPQTNNEDLDDDDEEDADIPEPPRSPQLENANPFSETPYENAPPPLQQDIVSRAQLILGRMGYYRDEIDGLYGPALNFALRNYQARLGLEPSGRLDVETLASLNLLPEQRTTQRRMHRRFFPPPSRMWPERIYIPR